MSKPPASTLGEIIRRQRELAEMSMRQFAQIAGISNPYLSQIERGLRAPSQQVLDGIARALKVSADALYEQAGMSPPGEEGALDSAVLDAIAADPRLTSRQKATLRDVYEAFIAGAPAGRR
jgi:transcriptional regulator with XRE-family HTH domain